MIKKQHMELLYFLSLKNLKSKYKESYFGMLWMLLVPFVTMATFYVIFQFFMPMNIPHYPLYLISGLVPWFFISFSVNEGVYVMANNANLIKKIAFPRVLLPLSVTSTHALSYTISLLILIIFGLALGYPLAAHKLLLIPLLLIFQITFCACISIILGYLFAYYRDIGPIAELGVFILFYATPIFYTLDSMPKKLQLLAFLNPAIIYIDLHRFIFLPDLSFDQKKMLILVVWTSIMLILAKFVHKTKNPLIADYVK
ncbi:ABC transporter permease [bacterium]|nr:ABC transporter permease [bacterium]